LDFNIRRNMEHDDHMMIVMCNHLGGRSRGEYTEDSSNGYPYATCVPGFIGMYFGKSF
jgi:hypothetical protein